MSAQRRQLPFLVLAPTAVIILGLLSALAIAAVGLFELSRRSEQAFELRGELLAKALAERVHATPLAERPSLVERAARRSGAELLLLRQDGEALADAILAPLSRSQRLALLVNGSGTIVTKLGTTHFFAEPLRPPLEHLTVVVLLQDTDSPIGTISLVTSVAALTLILVGIAALVAFALGRDVHSDVTYVGRRIAEMASEEGSPAGETIPVRSTDQVGLLTSAFNVLVDRFAAAEHAYRQDLAGAMAYDRDRSAFLAALSHELRTPLNAILGFTEVLLSEVDGPLTAEARENLEMVRSGGEHLRALIGDILDLSALESGELELSPRQIDVYEIAQEVGREARVMAQAKGLYLLVTGEPADAWADPRRVRQILTNVIGNAVKFTSEGNVTVQVQKQMHFAVVTVSDTGPGIATADHAAIFEEYRQSGDLNVRRVGTGLGLAITRRLVRMHSGFIEVESQLGKGSRFTIVLPSESDTEPRPDARSRSIAQAEMLLPRLR
jgi:signal transduction histidine kinase